MVLFKQWKFTGILLALGLVMAMTRVTLAQTAPGVTSQIGPKGALKSLSFFAGHWSCKGHFANGKLISSHETFTFTLDGHWLKMRHKDTPPHNYKSLEMWRYNKSTSRFEVDLFDNFGGIRHYTSPGWKNRKLVLANAAASGYIDRFILEKNDNTEYKVTYESEKDGKWAIGDILVCKEINQQP